MKRYVFAVRDSAAEVFGAPFIEVSRGAAMRSFSDAVNGGAEALAKHPEDFTLFYLGSYEDSEATFDVGAPEQIYRGVDAKRSKQE
jgi:hypothetical protein